jgi:hypothetical protein
MNISERWSREYGGYGAAMHNATIHEKPRSILRLKRIDITSRNSSA